MLKRKLSVKTLNEKCKALKDIEKDHLIKMLPKSMESHPIQFRLGSKIKRSILKLWETIVPVKSESWEKVTLKNLTMLCLDGSCQNGVKTFQ